MNEHISNHKWDPEWSEHIKSSKERKRQQKEKRELAMAQQHNIGNIRCYCCGATNHKANKCPERANKEKKDWWITQAMNNFQQFPDGNESDQTVTTDNTSDRRSEQTQNTQTQNNAAVGHVCTTVLLS